jgi:hypothetical protein
MAEHAPHPLCQGCRPVEIQDGTLNRQPTSSPGPTESDFFDTTDDLDAIHLNEFTAKLASLEDFVAFVETQEKAHPGTGELLNAILDSSGCIVWGDAKKVKHVKRYLLALDRDIGIIDMKHFFSAAAETYGNLLSKKMNSPARYLDASQGKTVFLGLLNEISQLAFEPDSAFSNEDLVSNRLGASFGESLRIRDSSGPLGRKTVTELFRAHMTAYKVAANPVLEKIRSQSGTQRAVESVRAVLQYLADAAVSSAY